MTHQVRFLPQVEQIIVLRDGVITEVATEVRHVFV